jgi:hypothetical protein
MFVMRDFNHKRKRGEMRELRRGIEGITFRRFACLVGLDLVVRNSGV